MNTPEPRSRTAWRAPSEPIDLDAVEPPKVPLRWADKLLVVAVVALLCAVGTLTYFVYQQQQYVEGRGEYRDAETERLEQRINDAICDLLDQLPEGGLLERPRNKYGCGPGIPLSEFPEDVRRRYEGTPAPTPAPAPAPATTAPTPTTQPPLGAPAVPNPPRPTPNEPPAGNSPKPSPPTERGTPLDPVTDTVCGLLPVCPEEIP